MPHRLPKYEQLWAQLEVLLIPVLEPFAKANGMTLPWMGPYPRFFLERKEPGDERWIDLLLLRESPEGYMAFTQDLMFGLRAGRLKQIRNVSSVCAYDAHFFLYQRRDLSSVVQTLGTDIQTCWDTINEWSADELVRIGRPIPVPPAFVVV